MSMNWVELCEALKAISGAESTPQWLRIPTKIGTLKCFVEDSAFGCSWSEADHDLVRALIGDPTFLTWRLIEAYPQDPQFIYDTIMSIVDHDHT